MAIAVILAVDILLTFLFTNLVGPAAFKPGAAPCAFSSYGLPGVLFRTPFYLLRFYIGIAAFLLRKHRNWWCIQWVDATPSNCCVEGWCV